MSTGRRGRALRPRLTKRSLVGENSRFRVYMDDLAWHDRPYVNDYLVVVPKTMTEDGSTGVAVLPVYEGKIGLVEVYRHAAGRDSWEAPRGFMDDGETPLQSALRELEEETGLWCDPKEVRALGWVTPDSGILAIAVHLFAALKCVRREAYVPNELGHRRFRLFSQAEVLRLVQRSEVHDSVTLVALYRYMDSSHDRP